MTANREAARRFRERNGAVPRPSRDTHPYGTGPAHGTRSRYNNPKYRCRCSRCRRANADYQQVLKYRRQDAEEGYDPTYGGLLPG